MLKESPYIIKICCAQVLVTENDISDSDTIAQVGDTTNELLQLGIVPIINENDAVTARVQPVFTERTREVQWDNDVLSSRLAAELKADFGGGLEVQLERFNNV